MQDCFPLTLLVTLLFLCLCLVNCDPSMNSKDYDMIVICDVNREEDGHATVLYSNSERSHVYTCTVTDAQQFVAKLFEKKYVAPINYSTHQTLAKLFTLASFLY